MKKKKHPKKIENKNHDLEEYGTIFGSNENFAFIAGYTPNGIPFGITHEEMIELENEQKLSDKNNNMDLPF
jgi:hypothetical protein